MRKRKFIIISGVIGIVLIGSIAFANTDSMSKLSKGEFLNEATSEDGAYTIKTYLCNGGLTTDFSVRGEVINNNSNKKSKNIYWDYHVNSSNIAWEDNDTVIINSHKIELPNGKYDWREK